MQPTAQTTHGCCVRSFPGSGLFGRRGNHVKICRRQLRQQAMGSLGLMYPHPVICNASEEHKATVFMLHGLGDTGHGLADLAGLWAPDLPDVKFVFPTAPTVSNQ